MFLSVGRENHSLSVGRENGPERGLETVSECTQGKWS